MWLRWWVGKSAWCRNCWRNVKLKRVRKDMAKVVLDTSAFLAVANREPGAERVYSLLPDAVLSVVNAAEVLQKLGKKGMTIEKADEYVRRFSGEIVPFDYQQASLVASHFVDTPAQNLSFC